MKFDSEKIKKDVLDGAKIFLEGAKGLLYRVRDHITANKKIWIIAVSAVLGVTLVVCAWNWKKIVLWSMKPKEINLVKLTPAQKLDAGKEFYRKEQFKKSKAVAFHLIQKKQLLADAYILLGKNHQAKKDYKEAKAAYQLALKQNRWKGESFIGLSTIAIIENDLRSAVYYLNQGRGLNIKNPMLYFNYGVLYYSAGEDYQKASVNFLQAINLNPKFRTAYACVIACARQMKSEELEKQALQMYADQFADEQKPKS